MTQNGTSELSVANMDAARIGEIAAAGGRVLHEVAPQRSSLEEAFMELTRDWAGQAGSERPAHALAGVRGVSACGPPSCSSP